MRRYLAALLLCFAAAAPVSAAPITIRSSDLRTEASDNISYDTDQDTSTAYGTRTLTSAIGGNSSTNYSDWQDTGSGALFDFDFVQVRTGAEYNYAYTGNSFLAFIVGQSDTTYSLSGLYSMTGPANTVFSDVLLFDVTTGTVLFRDFSISEYTANELFTLGVAGDADSYNDTAGSLTGTLLAGHEYHFSFANNIGALSSGSDDGATATGCVTLSIGGATGGGNCGVAPVPLPAAAWLLISGLAGMGLIGRRRKAS